VYAGERDYESLLAFAAELAEGDDKYFVVDKYFVDDQFYGGDEVKFHRAGPKFAS
jgi:hypothetical protein